MTIAHAAGHRPGRRTTGAKVYVKLQCAKCHGERWPRRGPVGRQPAGRGGKYINTRDFTFASSYRTGFNEREIIRTMETGMNGTPMPSYAGIVSAKDEYDMVAYLMSLAGHGSNQHRQAAKSMEGVGDARSRHSGPRARMEI